MFAVTPLVTPGLRAQPMARVFWFAGGALIAPWAAGAVAWALAPASSARGGIAGLGAAIGVYVFAWTIVKGLMKMSSGIWDSPPPAAGVAAAVKASLGGTAFIAAVVAVGLGLGDLLIRGSGLAPGTQRPAGFLPGSGALVVAGLFFLACAAIPRLGRAVSPGAAAGVFLAAKAAVLLLFAAYLAPAAVLAAGAAGVAACLAARAIPAGLPQEAGPAQDQSPAPAG